MLLLKNFSTLDSKKKALSLLACLGDADQALSLYRFIPEENEQDLQLATQELLSVPKSSRTPFIVKELKKLMRENDLKLFSEIHPGWFAEFLKNENPQTTAVILHYLPNDKAKLILSYLPQKFKDRLPKHKKFALPETLVEIVKARFEAQFSTLKFSSKQNNLSLQDLYFLKLEDLIRFFEELGIHQMAKAFKGLEGAALKALLFRLPLKIAKQLQSTLKALGNIPTRELTEAQVLLLDFPLETVDTDHLAHQVGLAFFSKGITSKESDIVKALQFKLPPSMGYLLKRYTDQNLPLNKPNRAEWIQTLILEQFKKFPNG